MADPIAMLDGLSRSIQRMRTFVEDDMPPVLMTRELDLMEDWLANLRAPVQPNESKPVGWFHPWDEYHGYQQVAEEYEGSEGTIPLYAARPATASFDATARMPDEAVEAIIEKLARSAGRLDRMVSLELIPTVLVKNEADIIRERLVALKIALAAPQPFGGSEPAAASASIEAAARMREAMIKIGEQADPVREMLRRMVAEFHDYHYHGCPADNDSGPCNCFAGALLVRAGAALSAQPSGAELHIGTAAGTAGFKNTDGAPVKEVLEAIQHCAFSWEWSARIIGNIRAIDISRACSFALGALSAQPTARADRETLARMLEPEAFAALENGYAIPSDDNFIKMKLARIKADTVIAALATHQPNQRGVDIERLRSILKQLIEIYPPMMDEQLDLPIVKIWKEAEATFKELWPDDRLRPFEEIEGLLTAQQTVREK